MALGPRPSIVGPACRARPSSETALQLHGGQPGHITPEERVAAEELVRTKFGTEAWLHRLL